MYVECAHHTSVRNHPDPAGLIKTFRGSHQIIAEYLLSEVVDSQPPDIQAFLLQTALLDRLSVPLCNAVTGGDTSAALLDAVERANLFLLPLDAERHTYRYHDLFAEALRARVWREQPELARTVHRRAAAWYAAGGMLPDAIPHLFAIGELEHAADLVGQLAESLLLRGEVATIRNWLNALPEALVQARLPLIEARIFAQMATGQIATLDADITQLTALPGRRDNTAALQVLAAMLQDADPFGQQQLHVEPSIRICDKNKPGRNRDHL
jgi:LuxR family maltose regulon positive regulatory protein